MDRFRSYSYDSVCSLRCFRSGFLTARVTAEAQLLLLSARRVAMGPGVDAFSQRADGQCSPRLYVDGCSACFELFSARAVPVPPADAGGGASGGRLQAERGARPLPPFLLLMPCQPRTGGCEPPAAARRSSARVEERARKVGMHTRSSGPEKRSFKNKSSSHEGPLLVRRTALVSKLILQCWRSFQRRIGQGGGGVGNWAEASVPPCRRRRSSAFAACWFMRQGRRSLSPQRCHDHSATVAKGSFHEKVSRKTKRVERAARRENPRRDSESHSSELAYLRRPDSVAAGPSQTRSVVAGAAPSNAPSSSLSLQTPDWSFLSPRSNASAAASCWNCEACMARTRAARAAPNWASRCAKSRTDP